MHRSSEKEKFLSNAVITYLVKHESLLEKLSKHKWWGLPLAYWYQKATLCGLIAKRIKMLSNSLFLKIYVSSHSAMSFKIDWSVMKNWVHHYDTNS